MHHSGDAYAIRDAGLIYNVYSSLNGSFCRVKTVVCASRRRLAVIGCSGESQEMMIKWGFWLIDSFSDAAEGLWKPILT